MFRSELSSYISVFLTKVPKFQKGAWGLNLQKILKINLSKNFPCEPAKIIFLRLYSYFYPKTSTQNFVDPLSHIYNTLTN